MKVLSLINSTNSTTEVSAERAIMRAMVLALMFAVGLNLIPATAFAQGTPDGQTPAEETGCDVLAGAAFGICNAYCEATDCGDGVNYADFHACASLQKNWRKKTGLREMPCDCNAGFVFDPDEGCVCGIDFIVEITSLTPGACDANGCETDVELKVSNLGTEDVPGPIGVLIELSNGAMKTEVQAGLNALDSDTIQTTLPGATNCFDTSCTARAEIDPTNVYEECDESNNTDVETVLG